MAQFIAHQTRIGAAAPYHWLYSAYVAYPARDPALRRPGYAIEVLFDPVINFSSPVKINAAASTAFGIQENDQIDLRFLGLRGGSARLVADVGEVFNDHRQVPVVMVSADAIEAEFEFHPKASYYTLPEVGLVVSGMSPGDHCPSLLPLP
jgi:hypothetical protein